MSSIALPGLSTGIDTAAMIKQMLMSSSGRLNLLEKQKNLWSQRSGCYTTLENNLKTLRTAADDLRDSAQLRAYSVTSGDEKVMTASASSQAVEGSHTIVIDRLATAERQVHGGLEAKDSLVGAGTFAYSYDGQSRVLQTSDTTSLEGLVALINNDAGNPGVQASILEYDNGDGKAFHLVLSGTQSGGDYAISVDDAQTTLDGSDGKADFRAAGFVRTQAAQNSRIRVDGYPDGGWIERSGNTIDDVIPGVTIDLRSAGTTTLSLSRDVKDLKDKVKALVDGYNGVVDYLKEQTKYDPETKKSGPLIGDYTVNNVRHAMRMPFVEAARGFAGSEAYKLAGEVGLSVDREGKLKIDNDKLDKALNDNYGAVLTLLGASRSGSSSNSQLKFFGSADSTTAGSYDVQANFDAGGNLVSARIRGSGQGDSAWRDATIKNGVIIGAEGQPEQFLQVTASYNGSATETAVVSVRQGLAGRLFDDLETLLDRPDGALALSKGRCTSAVDRLGESMDQEQRRLENMEKRLKLQYARLEQALAAMEGQRAALGML